MAGIKVPGNFPEREYGHCVLGNGVDLLYVDWSGSMSFKDQINGIFGYWYKLDRKNSPYGDPVPLLRVKYCLVSGAGPVEIATSTQDFDPSTAVLSSSITAEPFRFIVKSFLTQNHLFVLEFKFQEFPEDGEICFALDDNRITYTRKYVDRLSNPVRYSTNGKRIIAEYQQTGTCKFSGIGVMDVITTDKGETEISNQGRNFPYLASNIFIRLKGLKNGSTVYCVTCVMDDMDSQDYREKVFQTVEEFRKKTYKEIFKNHTTFWQNYMNKSEVNISHDIDYLYKTSMYLLKAVQFPTGAIIPSSVFPNNHGCLVYWDAFFDEMGFLRNNKFTEAKKIAEFWLLGLEKARKNAKSLGFQGAYYGWATDFYGYDQRALSTNQVHFNGDISLCCWKYFQYTGDIEYLKRAFPVIKETIDFLISGYIEENNGVMQVKPCESLDESPYNRTSDTWTSCVIIKGIESIINAADILGEKIELETYKKIHKGLTSAIERNCKDGILFSHKDFGSLNTGSILSLIMLDGIKNADYMKTFNRYVDDTQEQIGLGWGHSSRMRCLIFPWAELIAAVFLSKQENPDAYYHIDRAIKATNSFGGIAEYIWIHGLISRQWYVSAHGTFLWAIAEMLAYSDFEKIVLFSGLPDDLIKDGVSFKNISIQGNALVSCRVKKDEISVSIINQGDKELKKYLYFRGNKVQINLQPDEEKNFTLRIKNTSTQSRRKK